MPKTFTLKEAAAFMGVSYQAVQARFVGEYAYGTANGRHQWLIPLSALKQWQRERQERARQLMRNGK